MLGAGYIAEYHLAGLSAAGGAHVCVVAGRCSDRAKALAARFGIAEACVDARRALERADVGAVIIATPDDTHETFAIEAAAAGKAILLQKPMAGSVAAAERIVEAARRGGVDLQVSFMHRFFDEVLQAKRLIDDGAIGDVVAARIRNATPGPDWDRWFYCKDRVPHGVVDQLGVHGIDLALQLLGDIRSVTARAYTLVPRRKLADGTVVEVEVPDNAVALYQIDRGCVITHEMSMTEVAGCDRFRIEIYGTQGSMWLRTERGTLAIYAPTRFGEGWHALDVSDTPFGKRQHETWLAGIIDPKVRLDTARDAVRGMRVVDAIMRSSAAEGASTNVEATSIA